MLKINTQKYYKLFSLITVLLGVLYFVFYINDKTYKELIIVILQQNIGFHLIFFFGKDFLTKKLISNTNESQNKLHVISSKILSWFMILGSIFILLMIIISLKIIDAEYYDSYFIIIPSLLGIFLAGCYSLNVLNKNKLQQKL